MKRIFTLAIAATIALSSVKTVAQGVALNTTGAKADTSALLDVSSVTKGLLAPRMTAAQKNAIVTPATGLLVYQTDGTSGFYYNAGTSVSPSWVQLFAATGTTGSGNVVLANSPTLVTPNLGTIASGVGTTLTALNGSNISRGTIAATVGGTGFTSYTSGDILYASSPTSLSKLAAGASGDVLTSNGVGLAPSWQAASSGGGFTAGGSLTNNTKISTTANTTYYTADGNSITLPAASTSGQMLIILDYVTITSNGITIKTQGTDTISDPIVTGAGGLTSVSSLGSARLLSDGKGHWLMW